MSGITAETKICMVIGDPISHSLSPAMHNAGFGEIGIEDRFVYVACRVTVANIPNLVAGVRAMGIRGISCGIPHKREIMKHLDVIDPVAQKIGAVNTVVNDDGKLIGYNTDWLGIRTPLLERTQLAGKTVALLGAGGAARAAIYALTQKGASVTIFNRTQEKADSLAIEFSCETLPWGRRDMVRHMDIIVNTTSVGLSEGKMETPLDKENINKHHVVFDVVYGPGETRLVQEATDRGAGVISGLEMLLHQGAAQFELYTGIKAPIIAMRNALTQPTGGNMSIRYCLPIQLQSHKAVLKAAQSATDFDFVEVWVSCIQNFDMEDIRRLINEFPKKLILVLHPKQGQKETLTHEEKIEILRLAAASSVLVDLDIARERPILEQIKRERIHARIILSHHNYSLTPDKKMLRNIIRRMERWEPAIFKIATFCRKPSDAVVLLELLAELRKKNKTCIILGIGPLGAATRIFGTLWGNEMIFTPETTAKSSAPGQLTKHQLEIIFRTLERA